MMPTTHRIPADGHDIGVTIDSHTIPLRAIRVLPGPPTSTRGGRGDDSLPTKALVDLDGEHCRVSKRFWKSIFARYRFGASTFRYFQPEEVFQRICEVSKNDTLRVMVERRPKGPPRALAASRPADRLVTIEDVHELARAHGATGIAYSDGVVGCTFTPRSGEEALAIGPDAFANRFTLHVPVDGYGNARIHVALLRLLCTNGMVGHHRAFASEVPASPNPRHTIRRAIECFDHSDGFAAIRERFLSAQASWASVREAHTLGKQLAKMKPVDPGRKLAALETFDRITGRIQQFYGLTNLDTLPARRQRLLPVKCRVYDLLNFAGEVATHLADAEDARPLQSWIGSTLADEFDLEGTAGQVPEFTDLFLRGR
jgi:hypothetical protein